MSWWWYHPNTGEHSHSFHQLVSLWTKKNKKLLGMRSGLGDCEYLCHRDRKTVRKKCKRQEEGERETEEDNVPQSTDKLNVTRWLLSPSAVTVNSGLGKMSKMLSCAWVELITEPKAAQTRAANGHDLQIKLHLPRLFFKAADLIYLKSNILAAAIRLIHIRI